MSATSSPFGFRPIFHPSGFDRASPYNVAAAYGTAMQKGQMCIPNANGTVTVQAAAADLLGCIASFEYTDATGKPWVSTNWLAGQTLATGTVATCWVYDSPLIVYEVQADGSVPQTGVFDQTDITNVSATTGGTGNLVSACTVSATLAGAGVQGQFRIIGFGQQADNAPGDAFTIVRVMLARHSYTSNKLAI